MFDSFWSFLKDPANRAVLGWIGGGIVVVCGGMWAVVKFFARKPESAGGPGVRADGGGVAIGRDNINSPINVGTRQPGKR